MTRKYTAAMDPDGNRKTKGYYIYRTEEPIQFKKKKRCIY